jgi:hypothetical protein
MSNKFPTANITLASLEDKGMTMKIKDTDGKSWIVWKNDYQTQQPSETYKALLEHKIGDTFGVSYSEKPEEFNGKKYTRRTIYQIMPRVSQPTQTSRWTNGEPAKAEVKDDKFWEKQAYEKCCSLWINGLFSGGTDWKGDAMRRMLEDGVFWDIFQAIKADGKKRFFDFQASATPKVESEPLPIIDSTECAVCGTPGFREDDGHDCIPF